MSKYVDNYARHIGNLSTDATHETRFFCGEIPIPESEFNQWAFFRTPDGWLNERFHGRLIGESDNLRQDRLAFDLKAS